MVVFLLSDVAINCLVGFTPFVDNFSRKLSHCEQSDFGCEKSLTFKNHSIWNINFSRYGRTILWLSVWDGNHRNRILRKEKAISIFFTEQTSLHTKIGRMYNPSCFSQNIFLISLHK